MPSNMKPSPRSVRTSRFTSDISGQERSLTPLPWTGKNISSQDKNKVGNSFGQPYLDTKFELNQDTSTERVGPSKPLENVRRHRPGNKTCDDDDNELVKYMSNLPCFLQQMEKGTNIQEKALNFGVLDWKRLEKWKYIERMPAQYPQKTSSSSSKPRMGPSSLYSGKSAIPNGSRFGSPQRQPPPPSHVTHLSSSKDERNASTNHKKEKYADVVKLKGKETCDQEYYQTAESIGTAKLQDHFHQRVKFYEEKNVYNSKKKDPKKKMISEKEASSSDQGKNGNSQGNRSEMRFDELTSECNDPLDPQNIVLLKPKHFPKSSSESSQFTESRTSLDGQLAELAGNRLSDFFYPQELKSEDLDIFASASENKYSAESAEQFAAKGRPPSPTRRFSFDLGRMSRSLSSKDNSAIPQLSSTYTSVKSGPARPEISSGMDKFKSDHVKACSRAKSSPLRRLLDPLLKHKGGAHSAETVVPTSTKGPPSQEKKPEVSSTLQALLQLTLKNGLPFFKLVVNNSNDMLAASVKSSPTTEKSDPCMGYVFYSVHEIRKKSMNWMNQGSKSKNCSLGYNIVGEMKISSSSECDARECVLYGVDPGQTDKQTVENVPNKEIAAVIVRNSSKMLNDGDLSDKSTVLILPGGVHGMPIKGAPSPLISRWRFGGSCDCGGWDIGCKLQILADNNKKGISSLQTSRSSSTTDHVNLFLQGGEQKNKPVFSLKPFSNGYYSVEFDASISLLEAFATCVAYATCSKFPEITDAKSPSGPEYFPEVIMGRDKRKMATTFQEQLPAYVTCPPLSPAGRI